MVMSGCSTSWRSVCSIRRKDVDAGRRASKEPLHKCPAYGLAHTRRMRLHPVQQYDLGLNLFLKQARKREFLEQMQQVVAWTDLWN